MPHRLIGLDWGTSTLRGYLLGADGTILARREALLGIQAVPGGDFRSALDAFCGDWLDGPSSPHVVAAGMIGSRQGWREAAYVPVPVQPGALARECIRLDDVAGVPFAIVPGLVQDAAADAAPDVMRGEETKVLGVLTRDEAVPGLVVMPGTHCKWVRLEARAIKRFTTFMTGDAFAALAGHTILARTLPPDAGHDAFDPARGFMAGVERAVAGDHALLHDLFAVRTLALFDRMPEAARREYLSGLLVGAEVRQGLALHADAVHEEIGLLGDPAHVARYAAAFGRFGLSPRMLTGEPVAAGLASIARTLRFT